MLGLEAHRGGVRLSAQLRSPRISGYCKQTSREYLLPGEIQPLYKVILEGERKGYIFGNIMESLEYFWGNLIGFGSYTVCVKWWAELGWLAVWSNLLLIVAIMFSWQEMVREVRGVV